MSLIAMFISGILSGLGFICSLVVVYIYTWGSLFVIVFGSLAECLFLVWGYLIRLSSWGLGNFWVVLPVCWLLFRCLSWVFCFGLLALWVALGIWVNFVLYIVFEESQRAKNGVS